MDRVAVFVDAGYLFAQASVALAGKKLPRGRMLLDHERAVETLEAFGKRVSGVPLLRIYWYDGTSTGPTAQHITLAHVAGLKMRLGFVNSVGEQKGVDSLIVTDMIALARNGAMTDAVLLSGDEDLRVGVQQAQEFGVRVHLLGIRPSRGSQSLFLLQEADSTHEWGPDDLTPFLSCKPEIIIPAAAAAAAAVPVVAVAAPTGAAAVPVVAATPAAPHPAPKTLEDLSTALAQEIPATEIDAVAASIRDSGQIPKEFDGRLLALGRSVLKTLLNSQQKKTLRVAFLKALENRVAGK